MPPAAPVSGTLTIAADHPAFAGHFPGNPVLPGVVLLDLILAAAGITAIAGITRLKFLRPVRPGETITYRLERPAPEKAAITARGGEGLALRGTLRLGSPEEA